jgi:hypothetical protein
MEMAKEEERVGDAVFQGMTSTASLLLKDTMTALFVILLFISYTRRFKKK